MFLYPEAVYLCICTELNQINFSSQKIREKSVNYPLCKNLKIRDKWNKLIKHELIWRKDYFSLEPGLSTEKWEL